MTSPGSPSSSAGIPLTEALVLQKSRLDSLTAVKNLNLWGCEINDVSFLRNVPNIEVITLSINNLSTLRDFATCSSLREIYMRKNEVASLAEVQYLGNLKNLKTLWLCDNPCANNPLYRLFTIRTCPFLSQLDDKPVTDEERDQARRMPATQVNECLTSGGGIIAAGAAAGGSGSAPLGNNNNVSRPLHQAPSTSSVVIPPSQQQQQQAPPPSRTSNPPPPPPPSSSSGSRNPRKAIVSAILTLMEELNTESLEFLRGEIDNRLSSRYGGK